MKGTTNIMVQTRAKWLLAFFLLNAIGIGVIVWGVAFRQTRLEDMRVVKCTPQGEVSRENTGEATLEFSHKLDQQTITEDTIGLLPKVQGHIEQVGDKTLKFVFKNPLERATRYKIIVAPSLRGIRGECLGECVFDFNTPALAVTKIAQGRVDIDGGINLDIEFNAKVDPQDLRRALILSDKNKQDVHFDIIGRMSAEKLQIHIPSFQNDTVELAISGSLTSIEGPLSLKGNYKTTVTMVSALPAAPELPELPELPAGKPAVLTKPAENITYVSRKICFTGIKADTDYGRNQIVIEANAPFDASEAANYIQIEPDVIHSFKSRYSGLLMEGSFEAGKRYRITLKKGLPAGIAGTLGEDVTRTVWFPDLGEKLEFTYGGGYLSPKGMLLVPLTATNITEAELTVNKLYPENIVEYVLTGEHNISRDRATELAKHRLTFSGTPNKGEEKLLDLREVAEKNPAGVYMLSAHTKERYWNNTTAVVAVSDLGITSRVAEDSVLCWVTSIRTAMPVPAADVVLYSDRRQKLGAGTTDENGLCRIGCPRLPKGESPAVLIVGKDGDTSYLGFASNQRRRGEATAEGRPYLHKGYEAFITAERGVYRPGDTVHLSAFLRGKNVNTVGKIPLDLLVRRPDGREFLRKQIACDEQGRISEEIVTPPSSVSGYYGVFLTLPGEQAEIGQSGFRVEDYIPQTLSMKLQPGDDLEFPGIDQKLSITAQVKHLFGQPAEGLKLTGQVLCLPELFKPAGWKGYLFTPAELGKQVRKDKLPEKLLNKEGAATYELQCLKMSNAPVIRETVEITAHEQGGRALSESIDRLFYPWNFYLGVKPPAESSKPQQPTVFDLAVLGRNGKAYTQEIAWEAKLYAVNWTNVLRRQSDGRIVYDWSRKEKLEKEIKGSAQGFQKLELVPEHPGYYQLTVQAEGTYPVSYEFYVSGEGEDGESCRKQDPDELQLLADSKSYLPGQMATVSLQAPFAGTALVCVEGESILSSQIVSLQKGKNDLKFMVEETWRPNVYATVTLVRAVEAAEKWLPHRASGVVRLPVDCAEKKLQVEIDSAASVRPAQKAGFKIHITKPDGTAAANTAVIFAAVDMGVLALDGFQPKNPWDFFYALRRLDIREADMYSRLAPELSAWKTAKEAAPGGDSISKLGEAISRRLDPVKAKRVKTAVLFSGTLVTDASGAVAAEFLMPEYIGELKLMAIASQGDSFGMEQKPLPVKSPLMYRASWPRFLAPGDVFTVSVTLFNNTGKGGEIVLDLAEAKNLELLKTEHAGVFVDAGSEKTMELTLKAGNVGLAKGRLKATLEDAEYAESMELPVRPAAMFSRQSALSVIQPGASEKIVIATGYLPDGYRGNLAVTSNPVARVSGQLNYLLTYPYGCLEQTTSRMLPLIYMPDLARIVSPGSVGKQEVAALVDSGLQRLCTMQTWGGGLAMWPGGTQPHEWGTVYATDFMLEAKKAGFTIPSNLLDGTLEYLSEHLRQWTGSKSSGGNPDKLDVAAYAAYVLCRAGKPPHAWLASLEEIMQQSESGGHPCRQTARCYLAAAYLACGETEAAKDFLQSLSSFIAARSADGTFSSPMREKAIFLSTLLDVEPDSPKIPSLVSFLQVNFTDPWQASTQENAFALQALGKYARRIDVDPEAKAAVTIDGKEEMFNSAHGKSYNTIKPGQIVTVANHGKTPLYVYSFAEGVPADGLVKENDSGLSVRRSITDMDGNPVPHELKQGTLYRIHLELEAPRDLNDLVVVDMLAAGLEIENQDLKGAARVGAGGKEKRMLPVAVEKRDDRIILFADAPEGKSSYSYVVRAVSPGAFAWPACDASAMYDPAVFSVNGRGTLRVVK